jgi:hypothetical protein
MSPYHLDDVVLGSSSHVPEVFAQCGNARLCQTVEFLFIACNIAHLE